MSDSMKIDILLLIEFACALDEKGQRRFLEAIFSRLDEERRLQWLTWVSYLVYPQSRWQKIDKWMESRFKKNLDWTPRRMASTCVNYLKINSRMFPLLIKIAQRAKNRVYMRAKRRRDSEENMEEESLPGD